MAKTKNIPRPSASEGAEFTEAARAAIANPAADQFYEESMAAADRYEAMDREAAEKTVSE